MVTAGMNTSIIQGIRWLSWSRLARFALKNSFGQKAANAVMSTRAQMNT